MNTIHTHTPVVKGLAGKMSLPPKGNFPPYNSINDRYESYVMAQNMLYNSITGLPIGEDSILGLATNSYIGGAVGHTGYIIYGIPSAAISILRYDSLNNTHSYIGSVAAGTLKWQNAAMMNGIILGAPRNATTILKINTFTDRVTEFGSLAGTNKFLSACAYGEHIYFIPWSSTFIARVNPVTEEVLQFGSLAGTFKYAGGCPANGYIFCVPSTGKTDILVIDPRNLTTFTFGNVGASGWTKPVLAANGMIYSSGQNGIAFLEIDPNNFTVRTFGAALFDNIGLENGPNGLLYAKGSATEDWFELNPFTKEVKRIFSIPTSSGTAAWLTTNLAATGSIYAIPFNQTSIVQLFKPQTKFLDVNYVLNPINNN